MTRRRQRLILVAMLVLGVAGAATLALRAIGENMLYFFSPSQVIAGEAPTTKRFRVGGLVVANSVQRASDSLAVEFQVTDQAETVAIRYSGILPDLFREGQGIVAIGQLDADGVFLADQVLAKHDENYMPPEVHEALETAKSGGQMRTP